MVTDWTRGCRATRGTDRPTELKRHATGFKRLGLGLALLWFVFWTCAYVIVPHRSENAPWPSPFSPMTLILLGAVAIPIGQWVTVGFWRLNTERKG